MLALLLLAQLTGSAPVAPPAARPVPAVAAAVDAPAVEVPPVEPWEGSYGDGLREIRRLAEAGETDAAVLVAERLIAPGSLARTIEDLTRAQGWRPRVGRALESAADRLDLLGPPPPVRAEAQFARGVALDLGARAAGDEEERALRREQARLAFESARLLAGPGTLRLDATYQQGWIEISAAEEQRAQIPEISGNPAPPPPAAAPLPAGAAGAPPQPPDPLALARAAYLAARERFIERLRLEWRDPDTQANVELIQKRLRELDEIEQKRKQEEQQKKDEKRDEKQDPQQDQKPDESKDPKKSEEPKPQDPGEDKKEPDPKEQEPKPDPKDEKTEPKPAADAQNVQAMSKEEMMQLLERLERIEEVQKELQEKLKRMRRTSVEKDW